VGIEPPGRNLSAGGLRRRFLQLAIGVAVVVSVVAVSLGATGSGHRVAAGPTTPARSGSPTPHAAGLGLPTLGSSQVVETDDVGDPFVLTVPAGVGGNPHASYVLYWTTDWNSNVPTAVSSDLVHWRRVADSLPVLPSWAVNSATMTWGPTVHRVGATWVLYFSTEDAASKLECLGRATSSLPTGPFTDASAAPLVCQTALGGDIDPSVITDPSGSSALLWKNDGNAVGAPVGIWEQPLTADGLAVTGAPTRLLGADQAWEHNIIEGPAMLASTRGGWWLFYSGGTWQSNTYDTGVAWCATTAGPCRKTANAPLLASTPTAVSPGGFDTFVDGHGKLWASYSAFPEAPANARAAMAENRVLEIARVLSH
jgi:beta-xylosidase